MSPELLAAIAQFAWPTVVLLGLALFARPLTGILRSGKDRDEVTLEIGGQRLTLGKLREQQNQQTLDLQRQVEELRALVGGEQPPAPPAPPGRRAVLWVDDQPRNNALLIEQMTTAGIIVDLATSTTQALELAGSREYGAVITDMGRVENGRHHPTAGLEFVRSLRENDETTPALIFTSQRSVAKYAAEATRIGAQQITQSGSELVGFLQRLGLIE